MFWNAFFLTLGGIGLVLALAALLLLMARPGSRSAREQVLRQSQRERELHMENIQLRRRITWLECRQPVPVAAFAPDAPTEQQGVPMVNRYE